MACSRSGKTTEHTEERKQNSRKVRRSWPIKPLIDFREFRCLSSVCSVVFLKDVITASTGGSGALLQTDPPDHRLKSRITSQGIQQRFHLEIGVKCLSMLIGLLELRKSLVHFSHVNEGQSHEME